MAGEPFGEHLPGVGPWTAAYVALRSGDDDAFLPTDLGVKHGLAALGADPAPAAELAEAWRPYRGFAVAHLWAGGGGMSELRWVGKRGTARRTRPLPSRRCRPPEPALGRPRRPRRAPRSAPIWASTV